MIVDSVACLSSVARKAKSFAQKPYLGGTALLLYEGAGFGNEGGAPPLAFDL